MFFNSEIDQLTQGTCNSRCSNSQQFDEFFDEVDEFLSRKPCTKPKVVFNSFQIVIEDGTEDCEAESKGNVENVVLNLPSNSSANNNKAGKCPEPKNHAHVTFTGELSKKSPPGRADNDHT